MTQHSDANPEETKEWLDALQSVIDEEGIERAHYLINQLNDSAIRTRRYVPISSVVTPYSNTISPMDEDRMPGDMFMERQIRGIVRWNALAMVMRANKHNPSLGGHISTFASSATLYDVGFNYFFRGPNKQDEGDLIYYQGHSSPGIYARSFVEGRIDEDRLDNFARK
jgi:pyruvate dehydrogenase E1 component